MSCSGLSKYTQASRLELNDGLEQPMPVAKHGAEPEPASWVDQLNSTVASIVGPSQQEELAKKASISTQRSGNDNGDQFDADRASLATTDVSGFLEFLEEELRKAESKRYYEKQQQKSFYTHMLDFGSGNLLMKTSSNKSTTLRNLKEIGSPVEQWPNPDSPSFGNSSIASSVADLQSVDATTENDLEVYKEMLNEWRKIAKTETSKNFKVRSSDETPALFERIRSDGTFLRRQHLVESNIDDTTMESVASHNNAFPIKEIKIDVDFRIAELTCKLASLRALTEEVRRQEDDHAKVAKIIQSSDNLPAANV